MKKDMVEELREQQILYVKRKRRGSLIRRLSVIAVLMAAAVIFLFVQIKSNEHFTVTYYTVESEKIETPVRIALLSDLHSSEFGEGNSELIEAIRNEDVDVICMAGDMVNKSDAMEDMAVIRNLCSELLQIAPVYYCRGNHESSLRKRSENAIDINDILSDTDVVMSGKHPETLEIKGQALLIAACVSNTEEGYERWGEKEALEAEFFSSKDFKVLLCHYPSMFYDAFQNAEFDLAFAGHYHGGQIRLPFLGGLYAPGRGLFPEYSGGQYQLSNGTLIVSRGLGEDEENVPVPRINNRPELIIVELQ